MVCFAFLNFFLGGGGGNRYKPTNRVKMMSLQHAGCAFMIWVTEIAKGQNCSIRKTNEEVYDGMAPNEKLSYFVSQGVQVRKTVFCNREAQYKTKFRFVTSQPVSLVGDTLP